MEIIILIVLVYFIVTVIDKGKSSTSASTNSSDYITSASPEVQSLMESFFDRDSHIEITNHQLYCKTLQEYYEKYGNIMLISDVMISFLHGFKVYENLGMSVGDIERDLKKLSRGQKLYTATPSNQRQSNNIANTNKIINNYNSYVNTLKQYYIEYGDEMFSPSMIQDFINDYMLDSRYDIQPDDVIKDLEEIKKTTYITPKQTTTQVVQPSQSKQTQTTSITLTEDTRDSLKNSGTTNNYDKWNQEKESFYSFVTNMTNTQLIDTISNQYKTLKGRWNIAPCMGIYGSIEYATVLLLWKYVINNFNKNPSAYGSLQITLGDVIGCSFFGMPAGEWSDKVDKILHSHNDIVSYAEFGNVYNYLKNHIADEIRSLEFNKGNAKEEAYRELYAKFTVTYNSFLGSFSDTMNFYTEKGLRIKDAIHFKILN